MKIRKLDFSPDEFLVGVAGMKAIDIAVYWVVCSLQMSSGKPVEIADARLFSIIDARKPEINAALIRLVSAGKLQRNGDEVTNNRVRREMKSAAKRIRTARENGGKGGRVSYKNNEIKNPVGSEVGSEEQKLSPPPSSPSSINDSPHKAPKGAVYSADFDRFWNVWPHKVGKDAAWKRWQKRKDKPALDVILAAVQKYIDTKPADRPWVNPATWLNEGRWSDMPAEARAEAPTESVEPPAELKGWRLAAWKALGSTLYVSWVQVADARRREDVVTLFYDTSFKADHVRTHYAPQLEKLIRAEDPSVSRVAIDISANREKAAA